MKNLYRYFLTSMVILALVVGAIVLAGPSLLKAYLETGVGTCASMPLLCTQPAEEVTLPPPSVRPPKGFTTFGFPDMQLNVPKHFSLIKERIHKAYYRRKQFIKPGAIIYLLYEKPNFFINLFPQITTQGIENDYDFLTHTMQASLADVHNLHDAFFVVMKSIFTPGMGDQKHLKIVSFKGNGKKGYITYNLSPRINYFDCNIVGSKGEFFKVCIQDEGATLDLDKVLEIVASVQEKG